MYNNVNVWLIKYDKHVNIEPIEQIF